MAPQFALFLSPEGIALAQRQTGGHWAVLGDTPLDVPDLGAALIVLRKLAEARVGKGFETLILLPDDQILYTSLTAPGPDEDDRLEQIRAGLDGLTPYSVDDLVFDWFPLEDGRVKLAVVARETLDEARGFAEKNGFVPAGFGARPLDNRYRGVAHFDRTLDWTTEIPDIEFGHDTWHKTRTEAQDTESEDEDDAQDDIAEPAAQDDTAAGDGRASSDVSQEEDTAAETETETAGPETAPVASDEAQTGAEIPETAEAGQEEEAEDLSNADKEDAPGVRQPEAPPPSAHRLHLSAPPDGAETETETEEAEAAPGDDVPLQIPAGFGAHRRRGDPENAAAGLLGRRPRVSPGAGEAEAAEPELPRSRPEGADTPEEPVFGRAARKGADAEPEARAKPRKGGSGKAKAKDAKLVPERPAFAGPEPKLPPLARIKSRLKERPPVEDSLSAPGPNPFATEEGETSDRPSLRDRMSGIGRQVSGSTGKARDAATGLSGRLTRTGSALGDKLRTLSRKPESTPEGAPDTDSKPAAEPVPLTGPATDTPIPPPPQARAGGRKGFRLGKGGKPAKPTPEPDQAAAAGIAPPTPATTPTATPERRRFMPARRGRETPAIPDADAPIMGGLLARGDLAARNGPSIRTGLILTLILLVVLALVGLWAAVYLPETALGRWMGFGTTEEDVIIVETRPDELEAPRAPSAQDAPDTIASLSPEAAPPSPAITAPVAPELLPDIDAEVLDLGPAPVVSPVIDPETVLPSEEENANFYARTGIWQRPPVISMPRPVTVLEDVVFVGLDPAVTSHDAIALPQPDFLPSRDQPGLQPVPVSPEMQFAIGPEGLVDPTPEGAMTPYGILIFAGPPPVEPQPRPGPPPAELAAAGPETEAEAAEAATAVPAGAVDLALLQALRPQARPEDLQEQRERAVLGGVTLAELASIRPEVRPVSFQEQAAAAAAESAEPGEITDASALAVAASFVPRLRPGNIEEMVGEARAAGYTSAAPPSGGSEEEDATAEPATFELNIPSSASVARAATEEGGINLRRVNLIGVSGSAADRRALVRLPSGRFLTVQVGDRLDGGQVAAIGESSLQYVKRGQTITLEVPSG